MEPQTTKEVPAQLTKAMTSVVPELLSQGYNTAWEQNTRLTNVALAAAQNQGIGYAWFSRRSLTLE